MIRLVIQYQKYSFGLRTTCFVCIFNPFTPKFSKNTETCWPEEDVVRRELPPTHPVILKSSLRHTCCTFHEVLILKQLTVYVFNGPCLKCYLF